MAKLEFASTAQVRDALTSNELKRIKKLYEQWADEIAKQADYYARLPSGSSAMQERQMRELQNQLKQAGISVTQQSINGIKDTMVKVADASFATQSKWLQSLGFPKSGIDAAFTNVPEQVVERLVTGKIYKGGWSLSDAIWGDNEDTLKKLYEIVAGGRAQNKSTYDIAKDLERFVRPGAKKDWNLRDKDGRKIYPKQVDYNAQRLARTLSQHAYQQSFVESTKDNPFITKYVWHSNGSRVCEVCKKRDGKVYAKDELPLDHPNGMCIMEPVVSDTMTDDLAAWVRGEKVDPEIDKFAKKFGYSGKAPSKAAPGVDTVMAPQEVAGPARKVVDGKDVLGKAVVDMDEYDFQIEASMAAQKFDGLPKIADATEFDKMVGKSHFIAQRAYSAPTQEILDSYRDMLYNGKWYVDCSTGGAQYGQGMYCAADWSGKLTDGIRAEMKHYADLNTERSKGAAWLDRFDNISLDDVKTSYYLKGVDVSDDEWRVYKTLKRDRNIIARDLPDSDRAIWEGMVSSNKSTKIDFAVDKIREQFDEEYKGFTYVETFTLDPSAKVITYNELVEMYEADKRNASKIYDAFFRKKADELGIDKSNAKDVVTYLKYIVGMGGSDTAATNAYARLAQSITPEQLNALYNLYTTPADGARFENNIASYAVMKGYDAINAEGHGESGSYTIILNRTKLIIKKPE